MSDQTTPISAPGAPPGVIAAVLLTITPRWVIVVDQDQFHRYTELRRSFKATALVEVILDRRETERRRGGGSVTNDRRRDDRRGLGGAERGEAGGYRLAHRMDGCQVYEAEGWVSAQCPECRALLEFEMPRFGEPPARLELRMIHEVVRLQHAAASVRHSVETQAYSASGRELLFCRTAARRN